jgi:hypothetical protein
MVTGRVIYDHPPTAILDSPMAYFVAQPNAHVRAHCHSDSGHCTLAVHLIKGASPMTLGTYTDSCDMIYDLSAYVGQDQMDLSVQATDRRGQTSPQTMYSPIFVETSPYLSVVYNAPSQIADFSGNRLLTLNNSNSPQIVDMTTGSVTPIPVSYGINGSDVHLTSTGAVLGANPAVPVGSHVLFDWNNGLLDSLGSYNGLSAVGNYATWNGTMLRNLATQNNVTLPNSVDGSVAVVADSGIVAYTYSGTSGQTVALYQNGNVTVIGDNANSTVNFYPQTDGKYVVYQKHQTPGVNGPGVYLYDGNTNTLLSDFSSQAGTVSEPITYYQVNGGNVAYEKLDNNGKLQSWIRDTAGTNTQISTYSNSSTLDRLNYRGDLLFFPPPVVDANFIYHFNRNLYRKGLGIQQVCSYLGTTYVQDSTWYIAIGRTLFRLNLALTPSKTDGFSAYMKTDSAYAFSTSSFSSHFEGSGTLMSVVFTRLPAHGTLKVSGTSVIVNNSVARTALQNLVYTPATGYTGVDTLYWVGSNGYTISLDTGMVLLNVGITPPPAQPAQPTIAGLDSVYCSKAGTAAFTMTNFPDTSGGKTVVTDSLDGAPLAIGTNASCSFALSVGTHTMKVTYSNAGGSSSLSQSFRVVAASTPVVGLGASYTTIPNTDSSVTVMASGVSGGGSHPLFTFGLNRSFTPALYGPGVADSVIIDTASLAIGANIVYVRMQTSDSCYTSLNAMDSIVITRTAPPPGDTGTTAGGSGNASTVLSPVVGPNPFRDALTVYGLQSSDTYTISLMNANGKEVARTIVTGVTKTQFITGAVTTGVYMMRIYDGTTGKASLVRVLAMGN